MPSRPRVKRLTGSLRFRLTAWNAGLILVVIVAAFWGVQAGLRYVLLRELDESLAHELDEIRLLLEKSKAGSGALAEVLASKAEANADRGWFGEVYTADGRLVEASQRPDGLELPPVTAMGPQPVTLHGYRVVQRPVVRLGGTVQLLRAGASTAKVEADCNRLQRVLLAAGAVLALVAPAVGYWLAGRAIRPMAQVIATTAELRPEQLDERLPVRGTGDELDQLSATINGLLDRLAAYVARKRDFLANAAHELRSPLAAIRSSVEVALNADRSPQEYKELLADIVEEVAGLGTLVNQLLLLAESDAGQWQRGEGWLRLDRLAAKAAEMFHGAAEHAGVALELAAAAPVAVPGEAAHLRQVLNNLLDNAIRFTPPGGRVEVGVRFDPAGGGRAVLWVADTGVGIPAVDQAHVFERFYRADKARPRTGGRGSGLGLAICHALVGAYGGRIELDSAPGRGTRITVELPRAVGGDAAAAVAGRPGAAAGAAAP
jgi:signal transduction histidine kinase